MTRPNLEQDYIFDRIKGDYLHHETKSTYDADIEAYVDYLESVVKNFSIPDVVERSEQLGCAFCGADKGLTHGYMSNGEPCPMYKTA